MKNLQLERLIFTLRSENLINILAILVPGINSSGCCVMCDSPSCLPGLSIFPCWDDAEYVKIKREASKYVFIRENSIEYNDPVVAFKFSHTNCCCCVDPCEYVVDDNITVIYFDDPIFERMTNQSELCHSCSVVCFGGKGERIKFENTCCFDMCVIGLPPCPIIPRCCPRICCPCYHIKEFYVDDAQKAIYEIKKARSLALDYQRQYIKSNDASMMLLNDSSNGGHKQSAVLANEPVESKEI